MGTALSVVTPTALFTGQQLQLMRQTVAKDCNESEFNLFIAVAQRTNLDPFRKQIYALVFSKDDPKKRNMSIITGIDGFRVIAARSGRYRPDEDEAIYEYDPLLKGPTNPLGIVKSVVRIWIADAMRDGGWKPVSGWAYWDEFAPIKEEVEGGFDWVDTGETWADTGKPKKRKVPRVAGATVIPQLDTSGNWAKMPRVMIAKCAEAQALRKAFPEDLSGLYEGAEVDRARVADLLPSEVIGEFEAIQRLERVGGPGILFQFFPNSALESIPVGKVADRVEEAVKGFTLHAQMRFFESVNQQPLRDFWAHAPGDALDLKKIMDRERARLISAETAQQESSAA